MKWNKKIKAGAMQYVLVISVVIALLVFAFISVIYFQQKMAIKHRYSKETIHNTQIGFELLKVKEIPYNTKTELDFLINPIAKTTFLKKHWGIYDIGIVQSTVKNERFQKAGILGTQYPKRKALVLKDNNQSLVLVGNTKIIGDVLIPQQGVKSGNIAGISYYGNRLIYGNVSNSASALPKIKNLDFIKNFIKNPASIDGVYFEMEDALELHQSFYEKTAMYQTENSMYLANISLHGNIIISSKTAIYIAASATLENLILIAPKIIVAANFKGSFQAFATDQITLEQQCLLKYPSALMLLKSEVTEFSPVEKKSTQIHLSEKTEVRGIIGYISENETPNFNAQITIAENTVVKGEVYCTNNTALLGTVYGSVYTHNFLVKKAGGIYINHLYNGVIDATNLPKQYAGLQITEASNSVAKWVD
ncbi:hypothetical protein N9Q58_01010 [Polaribacter sp.]|nr:hypothetical protein [Polaribacter sp.]